MEERAVTCCYGIENTQLKPEDLNKPKLKIFSKLFTSTPLFIVKSLANSWHNKALDDNQATLLISSRLISFLWCVAFNLKSL